MLGSTYSSFGLIALSLQGVSECSVRGAVTSQEPAGSRQGSTSLTVHTGAAAAPSPPGAADGFVFSRLKVRVAATRAGEVCRETLQNRMFSRGSQLVSGLPLSNVQ